MSISQAISAQIPYLRRFSRALTGTQRGGDAYVCATLEAIVADPDSFSSAGEVRTSLYRLFLKVWGSMPLNGFVDQAGFSGDEAGARRNLEAITLRPRIAFLLNALEEFEPAEVAATLECSIDEAAALIDTAEKEIANQIRTNVLIIEDERLIALDLLRLVEELGHLTAGVASTHHEAVDIARRERPGLILSDIQLADDSSGLDAVNQILSDFSVPVIFITAFPERLLTGTRPEPAFVITKPFRRDSLKSVISQALFFDRKSQRKDRSAEIGLSSQGDRAISQGGGATH
jgi:CheY-like chemotaxis protein/DNA-directed RNA polymerase specialized sigma24 family protein